MLSRELNQILEPQKKRSHREKEVKYKVIAMILDKIKTYNQYGQTQCNFRVPVFIVGFTPYDYSAMKRYIMSKLFKEGFYTVEISDGDLHISWHIKDIEKIQDSKKKIKLKQANEDWSSFIDKKKLM
jgi:hypothetical protein